MTTAFSHATRLASFRSKSQDRAILLDLEDRIVVLVADGAGGIVGGGAAADVAVDLVRVRAAELTDVGACIEVLREADRLVERTGGETTAVIVVVHEGGLFGASAGDSEAWVIREDGTGDDLTEHQHLERRLGSGRAVPLGFERGGLLEGTLLIGTDGLFRYATSEAIVEVLLEAGTPDEAGDRLVELVRPGGSGELLDDLAVVIVRLGGSYGSRHSAS